LFVTEHFANNNATFVNNQGQTQAVGWGRAGLASAADWDTVIQLRQDAILNVGFEGFLAYNWGGNAMGVTREEQIQHEYYYRTRRVLASQKPQWLSDGPINVNGTVVPLSWSQPLNWLGGIPNAAGAEANFWRTNRAARTITLDGNKTIGKLSFTSPFSYTINPGTGGALTMNNASGRAALVSDEGHHTIGVSMQLTNGLDAAVHAGSVAVSGDLSGPGGVTKTGAGMFTIFSGFNLSGDTHVLGGTLRTFSALLPNSSDVYLSSGALLNLNFTAGPDTIHSLFIDGLGQPAGTWGAVGSTADYTSPLITGAGRLLVTSGPLVGDYNDDGTVDAADFVVWRANVGAATIPNRHPNAIGSVGQSDYELWRNHFGRTGGSGAGANGPSHAAAPEPSAWALAMICAFAVRLRRRAQGTLRTLS
jgi:hypothetical protein